MLRVLLAVLFMIYFNVSVFADKHEIFLNSGSISLASGYTGINLQPGYNFQLLNWLQVGGQIGFSTQTVITSSTTSLDALIGPTANVGGALENAYFFTLGLAFKSASGSVDGVATTTSTGTVTTTTSGSTVSDPSGVGYGLAFGKRFQVAGKIAYRPSVVISSTGSMGFTINALSASMQF